MINSRQDVFSCHKAGIDCDKDCWYACVARLVEFTDDVSVLIPQFKASPELANVLPLSLSECDLAFMETGERLQFKRNSPQVFTLSILLT